MADIDINQTVEAPPVDDGCITECFGEADRVGVEFTDAGLVKNITIEDSVAGMGDVQAGIEFIYHMREHLLDISVATVYAISVYALVLWIKRKLR
tara:strand:+ start:51 stop:335 length:285 start_codon:yes stop_codon:yes gene_type:complete